MFGMEKYDREKMMVYAKGELSMQKIPLTEENIERKLDDLYAELLAEKLNKYVHANDGINDIHGLYKLLKKFSVKYYSIIEQWIEEKTIHYQGDYFTFEEFYNKVRCHERTKAMCKDPELVLAREIHMLGECIQCFELCEQQMNKECNLTKEKIEGYKRGLHIGMEHLFFND